MTTGPRGEVAGSVTGSEPCSRRLNLAETRSDHGRSPVGCAFPGGPLCPTPDTNRALNADRDGRTCRTEKQC